MDPKTLTALLSIVKPTDVLVAVFTKRTTGETRSMAFRLRPPGRIHLKGRPAYDPAAKGLLNVWDVQKEAFRCIPLDAIESLTHKGVLFED